jgi:hypothetical protein
MKPSIGRVVFSPAATNYKIDFTNCCGGVGKYTLAQDRAKIGVVPVDPAHGWCGPQLLSKIDRIHGPDIA